MPPEAGSPRDWLRLARADLAIARLELPPDGMLELLCFHAQQAAEKSIKAVLLQEETPFPHIHSIERLVDLLPSGVERPGVLFEAARLTAYATIYRYPGQQEPVTAADHRSVVALAEAVYNWAAAAIGSADSLKLADGDA